MNRHPLFRAASAVLGLLLLVATGQGAAASVHCPVHGVAAPHGSAPMAGALAMGHEHAPSGDAAPGSAHTHHGCCCCISGCCAGTVTLPPSGRIAILPPASVTITVPDEPAPPVRQRAPFLLPPATAPPAIA